MIRISRPKNSWLLVTLIFFCLMAVSLSFAAEAPKFVQKDGRWALLVDGQPYLMLGGQLHNSSGWPSELPAVWKALAALHANTVEAPVYWEQIEPQQGKFNWDNVDAIVKGAREHNLHVVLLWFGTWKNGQHALCAAVGEDRYETLPTRHPRRWRTHRRSFRQLPLHSRSRQVRIHRAHAPPENTGRRRAHRSVGAGGKRIRHYRQLARFLA